MPVYGLSQDSVFFEFQNVRDPWMKKLSRPAEDGLRKEAITVLKHPLANVFVLKVLKHAANPVRNCLKVAVCEPADPKLNSMNFVAQQKTSCGSTLEMKSSRLECFSLSNFDFPRSV